MIGAIIGDMVGSPYEWHDHKNKDFELFTWRSRFTDDSAMTIAVGEALMDAKAAGLLDGTPDGAAAADAEMRVKDLLIDAMHKWGQAYPDAGYGGRFYDWLMLESREPYYSYGNGSGMRVAAAGWIADDLDETRKIARWTSEVTHNHPEGIKGAEAVAAAIYLAREGREAGNSDDAIRTRIRDYVAKEFGYDLDRTCDEIRPSYEFDVSCQGSVPEAIIAFLEGTDFEDVIRNAVSLGGDSDTIAAMAGSIAEAFYDVPDTLAAEAEKRLPGDMRLVLRRWLTMMAA